MRPILLVGLVALAACAPATDSPNTPNRVNSPAERLYTQASRLLERNYYGFSKADLKLTLDKYGRAVTTACASNSNCEYKVAQDALEKLVEELQDPHTFYERPESYAESQRAKSGQGASFPRLGVNWVYREASNAWLIVDTTAGLPAQAAGLARGDLVTQVNGKPFPKGAQESNAVLSQTVRSGQPFTLTVKRAGVTREVKAQGKLVNLPPLPYQRKWNALPGGYALLRIPDFSPPTVAREFHKLVAQNNNAQAIIVDLRSNPGGRATECAGSAGAFVNSLEVFFASRDSREIYAYKDGRVVVNNRVQYGMNPVAAYKGKVAVLVNEDSASCSEVMSALLQYFKRATVIGEPTFGILNTGTYDFPLVDGGGISITSIRTLDPSGKAYPERVTPNIAQKDDLDALEAKAQDVMLERAVQVLRGADARTAPLPVPSVASSLLQLQRAALGQ
jgi:carboxyl-terminal processing protease